MQTARTPLRVVPNGGKSGFTLVELLVVVSIIAILVGLLMPALVSGFRKAHETATLNLIHQCEVAAQQFFNDYGDYPPTHWYEVDELFKYDSNGDGVYVRSDDEIWFSDGSSTGDAMPNSVNEGIEVFLACVATQTGGPYLDLSDKQLGNTDADSLADTNGDGEYDLADMTNWYFNSTEILEIVDWWGNPLTYIHNRDYARYDGWDEATNTWNLGEDMTYAQADGAQGPVYGRSSPDPALNLPQSFRTGNYPKLDAFQLFSWGFDQSPGCAGSPNPQDPGIWPGWTGASGNLTNWEE